VSGRAGQRGAGDVDALVVCTPGIEALLDGELEALGIKRRRVVRGGVEVTGLRQRQLYAANLWLRCATRVLVRMGSFRASTFAELEAGADRLDWQQFVPDGSSISFRVTSHRSRLHHTGAVAERLATAAGAPLADADDRHDDESPASRRTSDPARFVVRLDVDRCTISADSSGEPLHHRGWRRQVAKAPLRPTLAAAALAAVGWPSGAVPNHPGGTGRSGLPDDAGPPPPNGGRRLLVDPFCGSGTIAIEAALAAAGLPSTRERSFAFTTWADFAPGTWASVQAAGPASASLTSARHDAADGGGGGGGLRLMCADRDAGAVAATQANATRAGVSGLIEANVAAVGDLVPPAGPPPGPDDVAWVVTNPPWGGRLGGGGDLRDLYATLGRVLTERFAGWRVALVVADRRLAAHTGLSLHEVVRTTSGGQPVVVLVTPPLGSDRGAARRRRAHRGSPTARRG
jgi:putative N6-adenine-specific DNA methylase